jgi:Fur family iron response transcriptional regulator
MTRERSYSGLIARLKAGGLRPTRQRLALARLLFEREDRHLTAEQLHSEALEADVRVSVATVYNTLHQFTKVGLLREVVVEPGRSYFDPKVAEHHHFYFESTGDLQDIPSDQLRVAELPEPPGGTRIARVDVVVRVQDLET